MNHDRKRAPPRLEEAAPSATGRDDGADRDRLIGDGLLRPRSGPATSILDDRPMKLSTSISQALAEDRIDRL